MEDIYQLVFIKSIGIVLVLAAGCMLYMVFMSMYRIKAITTKESIAYWILSAVIFIGGLSMVSEATTFNSKITAVVWFVPITLIWGIAVLLYAYLILVIVTRYAIQKKQSNTKDLSESTGE